MVQFNSLLSFVIDNTIEKRRKCWDFQYNDNPLSPNTRAKTVAILQNKKC